MSSLIPIVVKSEKHTQNLRALCLSLKNKPTLKVDKYISGQKYYKRTPYKNIKYTVYAQLTSLVYVTVFKIN